MGLRYTRRRGSSERELAIKRFRNQSRRNMLASPGPNAFIIVLDHLKPRFNVGKIFRSADAFGVRQIHLVGIDFFDPAVAKGSFKWVPTKFYKRFEDSYGKLSKEGYTFYTLESTQGENLTRARLPAKSAFVFGHEEFGLNLDTTAYPDIRSLRIAHFGKVQSLNVSIAASIVMYEYVRQHARPGDSVQPPPNRPRRRSN